MSTAHQARLAQRAAAGDAQRRVARRRARACPTGRIAWLFIAPTIAAAAGDQHLPADLDDPAVVHQLPRQPAERAGARWSASTTIVDILTDRGHLAGDAGDGAFRVLDDRDRDAARLRPCLLIDRQVPRPRLLDHDHPAADDAVAGGGRQFLDLPLPAADRAVQLRRRLLHRHRRRPRSR